jgi:hypothetical protein
MSLKIKRSRTDATTERDAGADTHASLAPAVASATYFVTGPDPGRLSRRPRPPRASKRATRASINSLANEGSTSRHVAVAMPA